MTLNAKAIYVSIILVALFALVGCSGNDEPPLEVFAPEQIYRKAEQTFLEGDLTGAAETFAEIERLYPYSEWASRGTIMSAFAYNKAREYEKSRAAAKRYLSFYPGQEDAAYAQYLVALSYYDQAGKKGRDQHFTISAMQSFQEVMEEYGDSEYARSSALKFDLMVDQLAAKEMEVGRYYLKRGHFGAAINRFQIVVEDFGTTTHAPEALHRLVEAYLSLGLDDEAQEAAVVLGHNFGNSEWYADTYRLLEQRGLEQPVPKENLARQIYRRTIKGDWL